MISKATDFVHILIANLVAVGDCVVDATCGNGYDTAFLAAAVGPSGHVLALDIQDIALHHTKELIGPSVSHVVLQKASHDQLAYWLNHYHLPAPKVVVFNLGYLPGSDKLVRTSAVTTIPAVSQAISAINTNGAVILVLYSGHPGGKEEAAAIEKWLSELDPKHYAISRHQWINLEGIPPYVLVIQPRS